MPGYNKIGNAAALLRQCRLLYTTAALRQLQSAAASCYNSPAALQMPVAQ
jgi:hypothetical protein